MTTSLGSCAGKWGLLAAGFVSQGSHGSGDLGAGAGEIILGTLLGAFCGLIFGLITNHILRYCSFVMGRYVNGSWWTVCSVVLGALLFALLAATDVD